MVNRSWKSGFTLLEVLLGVVIFSLIIGAVYSTFRAGLRMYRVGTAEKQMFQEARILSDFTQRDIRSILAIDETYYDIPPFPIDTTQDIDYSYDTSWVRDETSYSNQPYPFLGSSTTMSFYTYAEVPLGVMKGLREGIFHVDYDYTHKILYRNTDEVTGNTQENEDLVHHILKLRFNYGYKKNNKWHWVDSWDSRRDIYRHEKDDAMSDSLLNVNRTNIVRIYPDNLPDAVRIQLTMQELDNPKAPGREFEWISAVPATKTRLYDSTDEE